MSELARNAFDRNTLTGIIETYDLYRSDRGRSSAEELVHQMRVDIGIQLVSPRVFQVSFASSDGRKAQQVAQELMSRLIRTSRRSPSPHDESR